MAGEDDLDDSKSTYQGPLQFVNHDPSNWRRRSRGKTAIRSHVQSEYHRWRRAEDAKRLRALRSQETQESRAAEAHEIIDLTGTRPYSGGPYPHDHERRREDIHSGAVEYSSSSLQRIDSSSTSSTLNWDDRVQGSQDLDAPDLDWTLIPFVAPLSPLSGNSDPFASLPINIDSRTNEIIRFSREYFIPAQFSLPANRVMEAGPARRNWIDFCNDMTDPGAAFAVLSLYATGAAIVSGNPVYERQALAYRVKSSVLLRERLEREMDKPSPQMYSQLRRMFSSEVLAGNRSAAHAHGKMVTHLLQQDDRRGSMDALLLGFMLWHDIALSTMQMCRPVLDIEGWIPEALSLHGINKQSEVITRRHAKENVDPKGIWRLVLPDPSPCPCVQSPRLQQLLNITHLHLHRWYLANADPTAGTQYVLNLFYLHGYVVQGRLVNFYLDTVEELHQASRSDKQTLLTYAALAQASIWCVRSLRKDVFVCGKPLYNATPTVLKHIKQCLLQSAQLVDLGVEPMDQNARLWVVLVGALAERAWLLHSRTGEEGEGWFRGMPAGQVKDMGLKSWEEVREAMRGFPTVEGLLPNKGSMPLGG